MSRGKKVKRKVTSLVLTTAMTVTMLGVLPESTIEAEAAAADDDSISNGSLTASIGDLGEISSLTIDNNRKNSKGNDVNFVLPNDSSQQNNEAHQWMGEMIFSYRSSKDGKFPTDDSGFEEVDTNKTMAAGGSTTYSNASANLKNNPYIEKKVDKDKIEVTYKGLDEDATQSRVMKGFNAKSVYDMDTDDGSLLWSITLENTSENYLEFGDVGLPMPWNNKYANIEDTYNNRTTVHTFAGADSGYAYAIRCSGEGNYVMFTPVAESGAKIEYIDNWTGNINGVNGTRAGKTYENWTSDSGGWFPGLQVYYIHSKDIQKTGRGYYTDASSLVLKPGDAIASPVDGVTLTGIGYVDGRLHVQVYYADILKTDNHGSISLVNRETGEQIECGGSAAFFDDAGTGSYEDYVFTGIEADALGTYALYGTFVTSAGPVKGNWSVTFPLENTEGN